MLPNTVLQTLITICLVSCAQATVKHPTDCVKQSLYQYNFNALDTNDAQSYMPSQSQMYYQCPRATDPDDFLRCCGANECCQVRITQRALFPAITEQNVPYVIVVAVVLACLLVIVTLTICCFVSICPLYNTCRVRYYRDEASCTNKLSEIINTSLMPGEEPIGHTVVIAKKFDSDDMDGRTVVNGKQFIESTKITRNTNEFAV